MESATAFPFSKLIISKYLTIDVLLNIDYLEAYNFMFNLNKVTRAFFTQNFISVRDGFTNEGLIDFCFYRGL